MTFHGRLRLFFTIIVVVPMLAIAAVLFSLTADSERGKADAGIATGLNVSLSLYAEGRREATADLRRVARDGRLNRALARSDHGAARARMRQLVRADPRIVSARLTDAEGDTVARAGSPRGVAPASAFLVARGGGRRLGTLSVSVTDARSLVREAARRTRLEYLVLRDGRAVAGTAPRVGSAPSGSADFEAGGREYRSRRVTASRAGGAPEEIAVFQESGDVNSAISDSRILIGAIIVAFLLLALATSVFVVRALQEQIEQFLSAARRLASGRFDQPVPTSGQDEFSELGREFNSMSKQLEGMIREVEGKRRELEETIRRVGKALSSGLDPQGVLDLTVQTALDACEAQVARALPIDRSVLTETWAGSRDSRLVGGLEQAERSAFVVGPQTARELTDLQGAGRRTGNGRAPVAAEQAGVHALALPLMAGLASQTVPSHVGVISVARAGRPFSREEAEMLQYLAGQAVVSIENADLHATVQMQAVTDELTGLANTRQLERSLDREFDRRRRFGTPIGFVYLDIDDFKQVNDRYGHPQGNEVLIAVAGVLRDEARDIDEPARWGGEEFVVVLPQTDMAGAEQLAERMRSKIENLKVARLGGGERLRVTASFGVASVPESAADRENLVHAADQALLRAKALGKNRVERADDDANGGPVT